MATRSIRPHFYFTIIAAVVIVGLLFAFAQYKFSEKNNLNKLRTQTELTTNRLLLNLSIPLWNISPNSVGAVVDSELEEQNIYSIVVKDEDKESIITSRKKMADGRIVDTEESPRANLIVSQKDVLYKGSLVGEVTVYATEEHVRSDLSRELLITIFFAVILALILCLILGLSLNRLVIAPVIDLSNISANIAKGDFEQDIDLDRKGEIATLAENLDKIQISFQILYRKMRKTNRSSTSAF